MPKSGASQKAISKSMVGTLIADLRLAATGPEPVSLRDIPGRARVLYFYPKDATPGCTMEGQDFSRLLGKFRALGADVFGVSRDSLAAHEKFKAKQKYRHELLSDSDERLCQALDVIKMKNMYGRRVRGIERSTFVLDGKGKVIKEWRGVRVPGHAEEVLAFIKEL